MPAVVLVAPAVAAEVDEPSLVVLWAICDDRLNDPIAQ